MGLAHTVHFADMSEVFNQAAINFHILTLLDASGSGGSVWGVEWSKSAHVIQEMVLIGFM